MLQSWWNFRHLPNILFVHYGDMFGNLEGEIRRITHFLDLNVPESAFPTILRNCTLAEMRATALSEAMKKRWAERKAKAS